LTYDLLVIGSGPVGSAFARTLFDLRPSARILMVEVGPQLTDPPGVHVKNIADDGERLLAQVRSQGPTYSDDDLAAAAALVGKPPAPLIARPGTFFLDPERAASEAEGTLSVAAISSNVGGMGSHWTCACPHPDGRELVPFVAAGDWSDALARARELLCVTQDAFPRTVEGEAVLRTLGEELDGELPEGRRVQRMPLACRLDGDGTQHWAGSDVVLGPLSTAPPPTFELRSETLCRQLLVEGGRVTGALLEHVPTGARETVGARVVVAACDGLRTPQLLWASGIRPRALGRYLNDHIQLMGTAQLDPQLVERAAADPPAGGYTRARRGRVDPIVGVFWIPYSEAHPFHGQVMHIDLSPVGFDTEASPGHQVIGVGYFIPKQIRANDRVVLSDSAVDVYGMPRIEIEYALTDDDRERIEVVRGNQRRAAGALGGLVPGRPPQLMPLGSSLHYQGSTRMGEADDGTSVCDPTCRVWGLENLIVAGNGVIPTPTAGNPTLSSVAHAVRAARAAATAACP
jgi:choline dehydrogenase-like flavoprotein